MPKVSNTLRPHPCMFDGSIECPVLDALDITDYVDLGKVYCPICPKRLKMLEK